MDGKSTKGVVKDCELGPAGSRVSPRVHKSSQCLVKSSPSQVTDKVKCQKEVRKTFQLCPLFTSNKKGEIQMIKEYQTGASSEHTRHPRTSRVKLLCHRDKDKVKGAKFLTGTNIFINKDISESKKRIF